jgi:acetyltransferase-like isoleucine patch superfamily enzyme
VIHGNHCAVSIGSGLNATDLLLWCEDDESSIHIGKDAIIAGATQLAATEGKKIVIGDNLLCSNAVTIRTGDSHSIYDENGTRVNHAKDVVIGSHVWVGNQVIILKGSSIGDESVVGSGAIVTGGTEPRVVLAGNPARIVKRKITWDFAR